MSELEQTSAPAPEQTSAPVAETPAPQLDTSDLPPKEARQDRRDAIYSRLEDFISASQEDERLKSDEILNSEGGYTGIDYNAVVSELPEEGKKLLSNMRSDYTRKTQEIAAQRKALEAEKSAWDAQRRALVENQEFHQQIDEKANAEIEFNPYDEASYRAHVNKEVARQMQDMLQPMRQEHELQMRKGQLSQFKSAHPDLGDYKEPIYRILKANQHLSLEDAYWMVKGKALTTQSQRQNEELQKYRKATQDAGLLVGGTSRAKAGGVPDSVRKQGGWAVAQHFMKQKG